MPAKKVEIAFLGDTGQLEAQLRRAGLIAEDTSKKIKGSADLAGQAAAKQAKEMGASADEQAAAAGRAAAAYEEAAAKIGRSQKIAGDAAAKAARAVGASVDEQRAAYLRAIAAQGEYEAATRRATKAQEDAAAKVAGLKSRFVEIGKWAAVGFGGAAVEAARMGEKFQTATASIAASADISQKAAEDIGKAFLNTAGDSVFSGTQMAQAFATVAGQLKITEGHALSAGEALHFMTAAGDLAEAAQTGLGTATSALSQIMQGYHLRVDQAGQASDVLFNVSRALHVPIDTVAQSMNRLHGRLGDIAPGLGDVSGLMVELGQHGVQGSRGVMVVNSALQTLVAGTAKGKQLLQALGVSIFDAHGRFIGLQSVIAQLQPKFAQMTQQQQDLAAKTLFGAGAAQVMLGVIRQGPAAFQQAADAASKLGTSHNAAAQQGRTFHDQMEKLKATVEDLGTKFGLVLIPKLQAVAQWLSSGIGWLQKHKAAAEALAATIGGVLGLAVAAFAYQKAVAFVNATKDMLAGIGGLAKGISGAAVSILTKFGLIDAGAQTMETKVGVAAEGAGTQMHLFAAETATATAEVGASAEAGAATVDAALGSTGIGLVLVGLGVGITELATHWDTVWNDIEQVTVSVANTIIGVINKVIGGMNSLLNPGAALGPAGAAIGAALGLPHVNVIPTIPTISAGGASVTGPNGVASSVGQSWANTPFTGSTTPWWQQGANAPSIPGYNPPSAPSPTFTSGPGIPGLGSVLNSSGKGGKGSKTAGISYTPASFAVASLLALGIVPTPQNVRDFTAWEQQEGGNWNNSAKFNPLNTTMQAPGATSINSAGVKAYTNWTQGLKQTVATLKLPSYLGILAALQGNASLGSFSSAVSGSPWGTGAIGTHGLTLTPAEIKALENQVGGVSTVRSTAAATSVIPAAVATMLAAARALIGTRYTWGGGHGSSFDPIDTLKKIGVDCSGFVSAVLPAGGVRMPGPQTTAGLPSYLAHGQGSLVTVWDRPSGSQAHTIIDILGKWFESGGNSQFNPAGGVAEMTAKQAAGELGGGGFEPFHPTGLGAPYASVKQLAALGISAAAAPTAVQQQNIVQLVAAYIQAYERALVASASTLGEKLGNVIQNGTVKTLEAALGASTGKVLSTTHQHTSWWWGDPWRPYSSYKTRESVGATLHDLIDGRRGVTRGLSGRASISQIDRALLPTLGKALAGSQQEQHFQALIRQLDATHNKGLRDLANRLVAEHKAALATLGQELYAEQLKKDTEGLNLQATMLRDQTQMLANTDQDLLNVAKAGWQKLNDAAQAQVTAVKDATQTMSDEWARATQEIQDATQALTDAASATATGITDQAQIQVDLLNERGKYGLDLVAQKLQVAFDQDKQYWDQQIAIAQQQLDATTAFWHQQVANAQLLMDQTQTQQDAAVAQAQQAADTVGIRAAIAILTAQQKSDNITLHEDVSVVGPAQIAADLGALLPKAQQDVLNEQLGRAQGKAGLAEGTAANALQQANDYWNGQVATAGQMLTKTQITAASAIAYANQVFSYAQGEAGYQIALSQKHLGSVTGLAGISEARDSGNVTIAQAKASTQFAGTGTTVNIYGLPVKNAADVAEAVSWVARTQLQVPA